MYYQMSISSKLFVIASGEANVYGSSYYWNFRTSSFKQVACLILSNVIIWNRHGHEWSRIWKLSGNFTLIQCIKKCRDLFGPKYIGDDLFLGPNLVVWYSWPLGFFCLISGSGNSWIHVFNGGLHSVQIFPSQQRKWCTALNESVS